MVDVHVQHAGWLQAIVVMVEGKHSHPSPV
jgi:hypothetical protein